MRTSKKNKSGEQKDSKKHATWKPANYRGLGIHTSFGRVVYNRKKHKFTWADIFRLTAKFAQKIAVATGIWNRINKLLLWGIIRILLDLVRTRDLVIDESWDWGKEFCFYLIETIIPWPFGEFCVGLLRISDEHRKNRPKDFIVRYLYVELMIKYFYFELREKICPPEEEEVPEVEDEGQ